MDMQRALLGPPLSNATRPNCFSFRKRDFVSFCWLLEKYNKKKKKKIVAMTTNIEIILAIPVTYLH